MQWRVVETDHSFVITATRSVFVPSNVCCKTGKNYCYRCWSFQPTPYLVACLSCGISEACNDENQWCCYQPSNLPGKFEEQAFQYRVDVDTFPEVKVVDEEGQVSTILLTSEEDPAFVEADCYYMSDYEDGRDSRYQYRAALKLADGQTCPLGKYVTSEEGVEVANNVVSMVNKIRQTAQHRK